jgi:F-type H+-transporting ATPase subunit delta
MAELNTIARPYARALFAIARDSDQLAGWSEALAKAALVVADTAAAAYLARPTLTDEERVAFIQSLGREIGANDLLGSTHGENFLRVLAANGRLAALPEIAQQFDQLKAHAEQRVKVTLTAATQVDEALTRKVSTVLGRKLARTVDLDVKVDSTLMGGAIVRADDSVIDGSVKSRLQRLAETLIA